MSKELRAFNFEVRAEESKEHGNYITGMPIVFDSKTDMGMYGEVISRDALANTDLRDVRFLVNHNIDMIPLARSRNNNENSTMQMSVGEDGMSIRVDLDTENNAEAKSLYSAVKRGDLDGMSFMFTVEDDKWDGLDSDYPTRTIRSIGKVFEVSAVTFPAYAQTSIHARSKDCELDSSESVLESAKASYMAEERALQLAKAKFTCLMEV